MVNILCPRDRKIVEMRKAGNSLNEIARAVNVGQATVSRVIKGYGLAGPGNPRKVESDQAVANMRARGATLEEIALALGVNDKCVRRRIAQLSIPDPYAGAIRPRKARS